MGGFVKADLLLQFGLCELFDGATLTGHFLNLFRLGPCPPKSEESFGYYPWENTVGLMHA